MIPSEVVTTDTGEIAREAAGRDSDRIMSDFPAAACTIALRNVQVLADVGVYHHEIGRPQPLVVHVTLCVVPPRGTRPNRND